MARHGAESVLPYYYAGTMGMIQGWTMGPRLFAALGASRLDTTICDAAAQVALRTTLGGPVGFDPEELGRAGLVIVWGANLLSTNIHQWRFVLEARERGAHVVVVDPLRTDTARRADEHVALLPGSDAALALGLMRAVLDAGAADRDWLDEHTIGWPELERRLAEWPVERAAEVCGLSETVVRRLGERLATTRPTAIRIGLGLQRHGGGGAAIRAISRDPGRHRRLASRGRWRPLHDRGALPDRHRSGGVPARPADAAGPDDQHVQARRGADRAPTILPLPRWSSSTRIRPRSSPTSVA